MIPVPTPGLAANHPSREDLADESTPPSRRQRLLWGAYATSLAVVGIALYSPILATWFVGDDLEGILGAHADGALVTPESHAGRNMRPLVWFVHDINYRIGGLDPRLFRLTSVVLHIAASVLVALVATSLVSRNVHTPPQRNRLIWPFLSGAIFLVLPNHTESVSWISAQGDLLMTCFLLSSLWCLLRHRPTSVSKALGLTAFGLALACKETAIVFPVVVVLLEFFGDSAPSRLRDRVLRSLVRPWPYYVAVVLYLAVRRVRLGMLNSNSAWDEFVGESLPLLVKRSGALVVRTWLPGMSATAWLLTLTTIAFCAAGAVTYARAGGSTNPAGSPESRAGLRRTYLFLLTASVAVLAPVAHLGASATTSGGERLVYFSSAFASILVAGLLNQLAQRSLTVGAASATAVLLASAVSLVTINHRWTSGADLAFSLSAQMSRWPTDRQVYLLGSPDNLNGAFILRNAVGPTLVLQHGWSDPPAVDELSAIKMATPLDRVEVRPGVEPNTWRLRLTAPGSTFTQVADDPGAWSVKGVAVARSGRREIEARFPASVSPSQIWYISQGRLRSVEDAGNP